MVKIKLILFVLLILPFCFALPIGPGSLTEDFSNEKIIDNLDIRYFSIPSNIEIQEKVILDNIISYKEIPFVYDSVSGLSLDGSVLLNKEDGYVRVIVVDDKENEYLIFDSLFLTYKKRITMENYCEETCSLNKINVVKLIVDLEGASFSLNSVNLVKDPMVSAPAVFDRKNNQEDIKIKKLNEKIKKEGLDWVAGKTSVSGLSYQEKKKLFAKKDGTPVDKLPNLQGFEYYKRGIFEIKSDEDMALKTNKNLKLPKEWDWRNVHGENWLTNVKDQGRARTCLAYASLGALESQINLYYNKHLDVDLSEQIMVDCTHEGSIYELSTIPYEECFGENSEKLCYPGEFYCKIGVVGITDEACGPYAQRESVRDPSLCNYDHVCRDWEERVWKLFDFYDYKFEDDWGTPQCPKQTMDPTEEEFKKVLVTKGPMSSAIDSWRHAMILVGYGEKSEWKTTEFCKFDKICHPVKGCISPECNKKDEGKEMWLCVNDLNDTMRGIIYKYKCKESPYLTGFDWTFFGVKDCNPNEVCVDNKCLDKSKLKLNEEHKECADWKSNGYFKEIKEYDPEEGDVYWIFKNSWGENWGEQGYVKMTVPLSNLGWGSLPMGPFTPPKDKTYWPEGFNNKINCVDKDNDKYCNWGITEKKPNICPKYCKPKKDCDDSDPKIKACEWDKKGMIRLSPPSYIFKVKDYIKNSFLKIF